MNKNDFLLFRAWPQPPPSCSCGWPLALTDHRARYFLTSVRASPLQNPLLGDFHSRYTCVAQWLAHWNCHFKVMGWFLGLGQWLFLLHYMYNKLLYTNYMKTPVLRNVLEMTTSGNNVILNFTHVESISFNATMFNEFWWVLWRIRLMLSPIRICGYIGYLD